MTLQIPAHKSILALIGIALCVSTAAYADTAAIQALIDQDQNTQALTAADSYLSEPGDNDIDARFLRGIALARLGKTDPAIDAFGKLAREYPQVPEYANNLAVLYAQKGEYEKARRWLEAAMSTHPAYATAHRNLGDVYTALAAQAYSKALDQTGDSADLGVKLDLVTTLYDGPGATATLTQAKPSAATTPEAQTQPRVVVAPAPKPEPARPPQTDTPPAAPVPAIAQQDTQSPAASDQQEAVLQAVRRWAKAWSGQEVQTYLDSYADNFNPGKGQTLEQWRSERRERVSSPAHISVELINPSVRIGEDGRARVTFQQNYAADSYSDKVLKTLILGQTGNRWLIERESSKAL